MALKIFNTMSRQKEEFIPLEPGRVKMYTCGPTVYDYAHIGNFRAYVFEDLLRRYLKFKEFDVVQVQNLTDVDDKTIRSSREKGVSLSEYTRTYKEAFFEDLKKLNIERAEYYPAATEHLPEMIELIERLLEKGLAYQSSDRSLYFSISKFEKYGRLARLDLDGLQAGARVDQDEYDKDNAADFVLWKAHDPKDGDVVWDSPWGPGRPGWHIECSAMSMKYLGESFDIHTGGVDNIFPHHDDEIAQSEGATGKQFSKYWMHCGYLVVDGKKMSKSLGNFHTLRDLLEMGYSGREVRYELLSAHYRQSLNFSFDSLKGNRAALARLDDFYERVSGIAGDCKEAGDLPQWATSLKRRFAEALDDDLNISRALGVLFEVVHEGNRSMPQNPLSAPEAVALVELWQDLDTVLGVLKPAAKTVPEDIQKLVDARQTARAEKDFARADEIRDELSEKGWVVKDTPDGTQTKRI